MDSCAPNGPKICASVWTCGAESGAERWNRASGVESAAERRDASPDGSLGGRDERAFWQLERTGAGGVRDARCLWKEPKCALVVAGEFWRRLPPSKIENDDRQLN